jgi:hypothetical protein
MLDTEQNENEAACGGSALTAELDADLDSIAPLDGIHVGMLTVPELEALTRLVHAGLAEREYSGVAGFMGLPRVRCKRV